MVNQDNKQQQHFIEGSKLLQAGNSTAALVCFHKALTINPSNAILLLHAGAALHALCRYEEAASYYQRALSIAPCMGEIHNNLGNSLMALGRFAQAADSFSRASELIPASPIPRTARSTALQALGNIAEAEADCRRALMIDPSFAAAHWNLSLNLLLQGSYVEGWQEYEWRWQKPDFTSPVRHNNIRLWDGSPLNGRTILLHAEQGFGDAIQFIRYAQLVAAHGGRVLLECHPQLVSLFSEIDGIHAVVPFGSFLPPFSIQAPLLSLPRIFGTTLQNIPSGCPYLSIPAEHRKKWTALISAYTQTLRVGLVWAGKSYPDPLRSCHLTDLAPLASDRITFFSLQLGTGSEQTGSPPSGMQLVDLTDQIHDFADTAALIDQLDIVVSIDTAVAHLAGSLGKQVLLLLPFAPDWRWLLVRSDSPWYPTMHIFRQNQPCDWGNVIDLVRITLDRYKYV